MPVYYYRALNQLGRNVRGVIQADNPQKARQQLRADGLRPTEINETTQPHTETGTQFGRLKKALTRRRGGLGLLADMTRQAATLLAAGLPLVTALTTIQEQSEDQDFGRLLAVLREEVTGGRSLATVMEEHPEYFSTEYVHLVRAGEMAGALGQVLERLADNLERRVARRAKISAALAYPVFLMIVGAGVLFFLLSFIVPMLSGLFDNLGAALPWPTRLLIAVSGFMQSYWWVALLLTAAGLLVADRMLKNASTYRRVERMVFRLPVLGRLVQKLRLAQVFRGLAVMTGGGVQLSTALTVTAQGLGRSNFSAALSTAADMVGQGRTLADGLTSSGLFPPVTRRMVAVGEASGTLSQMLERVAHVQEEETDRLLSALTSLVEPVIILCMGSMVGFVVLAVLMPIFDLSGLVR